MGLNAFFAYTLVLGQKVSWQTALGIRKKIVEAIPRSLISAMSVGIGLFITLIGLVNLGVVVRNGHADFGRASYGNRRNRTCRVFGHDLF